MAGGHAAGRQTEGIAIHVAIHIAIHVRQRGLHVAVLGRWWRLVIQGAKLILLSL